MKKTLALLLVVVLLMACTLPINQGQDEIPTPIIIVVTAAPTATVIPPPADTPVPEPTATTVPSGTPLTQNGVTMILPDCLVALPSVAVVDAHLPADYPGPSETWPEHRAITFSVYPLSGVAFEPIVRIMPLATYPVVDTTPARQLADLQTLLATKPFTSSEQFPFLPVFYANQAFRLKINYLTFQNGQGVRFLTEYAQYYVPMNNYDLFYTFQGLTADGKYWISAVLPIIHSILPATADTIVVPDGGLLIPDWNSPTFDTDFAAYYSGMTTIMNGLANDSFIPSITCLDQFIQSLKIEN